MTNQAPIELTRVALGARNPAGVSSGSAVTLRIEARSSHGDQLVGHGETAVVSENRSPYRTMMRWAKSLVGYRLHFRNQQEAIEEVLRLLDDGVGHPGEETGCVLKSLSARAAAEVALLEVVAAAFRTAVPKLVSPAEPHYRVAPRALAISEIRDTLKATSPSNRPLRITLEGNLSRDLDLLERVGEAAPEVPLWWLEGRERYAERDAKKLIDELASRLGITFPPRIFLEQPTSRSQRRTLGALQKRADRRIRRLKEGDTELLIMASESVTSLEHFEQVRNGGDCRLVNLKPGRVGGILRTRDLVAAAVKQEPRLRVVISGTTGASPPAVAALHYAAQSIPQTMYVTRRAPEVGRVDRAARPCPFAPVMDSITEYAEYPPSRAPSNGARPARTYPEEDPASVLSKVAMRSHLVEREALMHGFGTTRYTPTAFQVDLSDGDRLFFGASARSFASSAPAFTISDKHKGAAQALLERSGVAVPRGRIFRSSDIAGAVKFAEEIGYPVVSKPVSGTGGAAVTVGIADSKSLRAGFDEIRASQRYAKEDVLVQEHIPGDVYRIMVTGDQVIAVIRRVPPSVVGDGNRSMAELVLQLNMYRRSNPRLRKGLINRARAEAHLAESGKDMNWVPGHGERVWLASNAYLNLGGESIDVLEETHPSIIREAIRSVRVIPGLEYCGVDMLIEDHTRDIKEQRAGVCELNSCPELITPQYPLFGIPRFVARELLRRSLGDRGENLPGERSEELSLRIEVVSSKAQPARVRFLQRHAESFGLRGWIAPWQDGRTVLGVSGDAVSVSVLVSLAARRVGGEIPVSVRSYHVDRNDRDGFVSLSEVPTAERGNG